VSVAIDHPFLPRDGSVVMFMLVRRPDGGPTGYPKTGNLRDGELSLSTYRKAAKSRYLLADDRVCCVVPDPDDPSCGVALYGHARPADADAFMSAVGNRSDDGAIKVPNEVRETVRDRLESDKRMVFRIDVVDVRETGAPHAAT
jgi:hypothetical protein